MNTKHSWIISAIVMFTGIINLKDKDLDPDMRTIWWVLTPLALVVLIYRWLQMIKENKKEQEK